MRFQKPARLFAVEKHFRGKKLARTTVRHSAQEGSPANTAIRLGKCVQSEKLEPLRMADLLDLHETHIPLP